MNGMELITAVQYEVPVTWIVENNNMHGITWHGSQLLGSRRPLTAATYRQRLDVATMARGMGVQVASVVAPGQLSDAVREALAMRRPALIDIHVDPSIAPPVGERVQTITGFTDK